MSIYQGQTALKIILNTKTDVSGSTPRINYLKPDNSTTGSWPAAVLNGTAGTIEYDFTATGPVDDDGTWKVRAKITFGDGRVALGKVARMTVKREWDS